jgi:serine/threonine-protein kinase RsbW
MPKIELDVIIPSHTRYLAMIGTIGEQLASAIDRYGGDREVLAYDLNVALTEAVVNAIQHAHPTGSDPMVRVHIELADEDLRITVWDPGHGFDLEALPPPNLDAMLECGRGLFLIRSLMDSVSSYDTEDGHILEMKKRLRYSTEATGDGLRRAD